MTLCTDSTWTITLTERCGRKTVIGPFDTYEQAEQFGEHTCEMLTNDWSITELVGSVDAFLHIAKLCEQTEFAVA